MNEEVTKNLMLKGVIAMIFGFLFSWLTISFIGITDFSIPLGTWIHLFQVSAFHCTLIHVLAVVYSILIFGLLIVKDYV